MANPDPTLEQEIGLAVHKAFQKHANRGWVRGGDKLSELMSDVAKSISPIFESHLNKAVVEELEFAYKMATPEQKQALKDLYADRGVNKGLSFTPQANLQSEESE